MLATMSSDLLSKKKGKYVNSYLLFCMGMKIDMCRERKLGCLRPKYWIEYFYLRGGSNVRLEIVHNDKLNKLCLLYILWLHLGGIDGQCVAYVGARRSL